MTLNAVFNISKIHFHRIALSSHCLTSARHVCCSTFSRRSLTAFTLSLRSSSSAPDSCTEADKRTGPRKRKARLKRNFLSVAKQHDPSASVLVDMLSPTDTDSSDHHRTPLDTARTEVDSTLKELDEMANIQIRDIHLAMEMEDENSEDDNMKTEVMLSNCPGRTHQLFGSPDASVPASSIPCHGCGAFLHCRDPGIPGYMPSQLFLAATPLQLKEILCQRCHLLRDYNLAIDVTVEAMQFEAIADEIKKRSPALLLFMVDLVDLPHSFYNGFAELVDERRPAYIIGNKVDLLPRDGPGYLDRVKESLVKLCDDHGVTAEHIALVSAKTGYGIEKLITRLLRDWKLKGQVFILGCTNAGKSTLFNALLASDFCSIAAHDILKRATASVWPGTTLNLLKFPIMNPKPVDLHRRVLRLRNEKSLVEEEEQLRRKLFKQSPSVKHATLMGHIGHTLPTPRQMALSDYVRRNSLSGFVGANYTYGSEVTDDGAVTSTLKEVEGREALISRLRVRPYDDRKFKFWCYDTPGLINPHQVINLLNTDELMVLLVNELIMPRSFHIRPTQVVYVSGLGRIDYVQGDNAVYFTVFAASGIPVHVVDRDECNDFYRANVGSPVLGIPLGDQRRLDALPSLIGRQIEFEGIGWKESSLDVILSSIGWVSVTAGLNSHVTLRAYTPGGLGCTTRSPALLKYAVNKRGRLIRGTAAYRTRDPSFCYDD